MAKNKITTRQARNIKARHERLLKNTEELLPDDSSLGPLTEGTVISRYGKQADVENDADLSVHRCYIRRTIEGLTTGDRVLFRANIKNETEQNGLIEVLKPRTSLLSRPDYYDGVKPVAANITRILIVSTREPEFSTNIIDRYLIACINCNVQPVLIINKSDLFSENERNEISDILKTYEKIGYKALWVSTENGEGIDELKEIIRGETTILVGQSGVGKSSIINRIIPEANASTNRVSDISGLGQHTTTSSRLYHLPDHTTIIDSPGIREFGLWHLTPEEVIKGYPEFLEHTPYCKFRDCKHLNDPGCAVVEAVKNSEIAQFRFNNYHRIIESMQQNAPTSFSSPGKKTRK
ncbi:small ribosomal subunit biogenesis GTPase RsgA [Ruminobacter sp.]|jgi:ribosome biogenesis GTPase|uniref:small ribosomal subunit biogenesis GTPase RsgA n=1 Tax=Ruminobacter sp. TaxID=2774296 RepID=UPI003867945F